jgi:membrane fusion protein, multidrug efflux system
VSTASSTFARLQLMRRRQRSATLRRLVWVFMSTITLAARGAAAQGSPADRSGKQLLAVPVAPVIAQSVSRTLALQGDLVAFQDVAIHARVQGFVETITVDRGSAVRRGALLARVEAPELKAQLAEAEAKVQAAEAQRSEAQAALVAERATFDRLKRAAETPGVVAGNDVQVAEQKVIGTDARVTAATRQVEAMRQAARSLRDVEAYLQVTAPFDGVVTERTAHVGTLVGPSSDPIVRLQQISKLRLVAAIPETYVASVTAGQSIPFTVAAFPGETFAGTLARVAHALDVKTRTMAMELDVVNASGRLAPGMFAELQWPVKRSGSSLLVPRTSVVVTTERIFAVRVRNGIAEWVDVKRGATVDNLVEVMGALQPGDEVAVRGTDELRAGTPVQPVRQTAK